MILLVHLSVSFSSFLPTLAGLGGRLINKNGVPGCPTTSHL